MTNHTHTPTSTLTPTPADSDAAADANAPETPKSLRSRQLKSEREATNTGIEKLRSQIDDDPTHTAKGRKIIARHFETLKEKIKEAQRECSALKRRPIFAPYLLAIEPEILAYLTVRVIISGLYGANSSLTQREKDAEADDAAGVAKAAKDAEDALNPYSAKVTALAETIGKRCWLEWMVNPKIEKRGRKFASKICKLESTKEAKVKSVELAKKNINRKWPAEIRIHLGARLLELASDSEIVKTGYGSQLTAETGTLYVLPHPDVVESLEWDESDGDLAAPFLLPMICPPNDWKRIEGGGYLTHKAGKLSHLIKHSDNPKIIDGFKSGSYASTLLAVNAIQSTPWRVNQKVQQAMQTYVDAKSPKKIVPKKVKKSIKPQLLICNKLGKDQFYFPCQLDFRGRVYAVPPLVNPQADDPGRSLIEFAVGKELDDTGVRWLQIHLANLYGACKGSLDQRVAWTATNAALIADSVKDPQTNRDWLKADKPWRFLAACFEWEAYRADLADPQGFLSHLPVTVDGSCNGFQHLSALLREPDAARATNLTHQTEPADFYREVAERLKVALNEDAETGTAEDQILARDWIDNVNIDRKLVKPAVMTTPYGAMDKSIADQLEKNKAVKDLKDQTKGFRYLAIKLRSCIVSQFPKADKLAKHLQKIARYQASTKTKTKKEKPALGMRWKSPTGFVVTQEQWECKVRRLRTRIGTLVTYDQSKPKTLSVKNQGTKIVPNFIHSLDASHLVMTINLLHTEGLRDFGVIHDGYSVHASDAEKLRSALKDAFVTMYEQDVLENFCKEQGATLSPKISLGDFQIQDVRCSDYFFS